MLADSTVIAVAPAPIKRGFFIGDFHLGDCAIVIASLTIKGGKITFVFNNFLETFKL